MRVSKLLGTSLAPVLLLLAEGNKNNPTQAATLNNPSQNKTFPELYKFQTYLHPVSIFQSLNLLVLSDAKELKVPTYSISEVIDSSERIDRNKYHAYYKIDLKKDKSIYIVKNASGRTNTIFEMVWNKNDKAKGLLFPEPTDDSKLVALVDAKKVGLDGVFEIYDKDGWYEAKYKFSPLLVIPEHTTVNSNFLINTENALRKFPTQYTEVLLKQGVKLIIAKNVEDSYYHYVPNLRREDLNGGWQGRKSLHAPAMYDHILKLAMIPQQYTMAGRDQVVVDSSDLKGEILNMVFHELGHAFDTSSGKTHSDDARFEEAHEKDKKKLDGVMDTSIVYFYDHRKEAFAELTAILLGGVSKKKSETILKTFPISAEYIRQELLPQVGINISIDEVRRNIYPQYLKKE